VFAFSTCLRAYLILYSCILILRQVVLVHIHIPVDEKFNIIEKALIFALYN